MSTAEHNLRIDYIEFPATDIEATKAFYTSVFGWEFTDYGPNYTSFSDGRLSGGFTTEVVPSGQGILVVIYASDLDGVVNALAVHGGKITKPIFEFPGGRRFHFVDPNGNEIAVWSE